MITYYVYSVIMSEVKSANFYTLLEFKHLLLSAQKKTKQAR